MGIAYAGGRWGQVGGRMDFIRFLTPETRIGGTDAAQTGLDTGGGDGAMRTVDQVTDERGEVLIPGPAPARFMFKHTQASWLWLLVRLWVGWQWLEAGWRKLGNPAWMDGSGRAIRGFWEKALATNPDGQPVIAFDWYRGFIQLLVDGHAEGWFSKLIVFGELAVGLGLVLGALTGVAAAGGLLMSESNMLAGTAATSPLLALLEILLIFAWKNAGYIGLDRWLLPAVIPWWDARAVGRETTPAGGIAAMSRLVSSNAPSSPSASSASSRS